MRLSLAERFAQHVSRGAPDVCWEWTKGTDHSDGYGRIYGEGVRRLSHRLAYELHHGVRLGASQHILHSCDNRRCCNPAHLRIGTPAENMQDKVDRNRQAQGEMNASSKLTAARVAEIRSGKESIAEYARQFGVSYMTAWSAKTGRSWKNVPPT